LLHLYPTDSFSGPDQENAEPLLGSSSAALLPSTNDSDECTDLEFLLAEGKGAVNWKKKKGPRRGG
jgi:hypothetical protein